MQQTINQQDTQGGSKLGEYSELQRLVTRSSKQKRTVGHTGIAVAIKQVSTKASNLTDGSLRGSRRITLAVALIAAVVGCGNSNMGTTDGGDGGSVVGDVVEYGVRGRPQNNRFCAELAASPTTVVRTSSIGVQLCNWDAPVGTPCGRPLDSCQPMTGVSTDFAEYLRNNRVPQMCVNLPSNGPYEPCDTPQPGGCGNGAFCATVRPHAFAGERRLCVPYPCNP